MTLSLPHLRLLHAYGNEEVLLEKSAGVVPLAARLAMGILGASQSLDARQHEEFLRAQAARLNEAFRAIEDMKMRPVREHMAHSRMPMILMAARAQESGMAPGLGMPIQEAPRYLTGEDVPLGMDEGMIRMASAMGADLAAAALEKDAGLGDVASNLAKGVAKNVRGVAQGAAQGLKGVAQNAAQGLKGAVGRFGATGRLQQAAGSLPPPVGGMLPKIRAKLSPDARFQNAAKDLAVSVPSPSVASPPSGKPFGATKRFLDAGMEGGPVTQRSPVGSLQSPVTQRAPGAPSAPAAPSAPGKLAPGSTGQIMQKGHPYRDPGTAPPSSGPKNPAVPKDAVPPSGQVQPPAAKNNDAAKTKSEDEPFDLDKFWERTGLSNDRWKTKLPMLGAGLLGAYGLYQGAKKGFEILGREPEAPQYNAGGAMPAYGLNQYGVPDRSAPFM